MTAVLASRDQPQCQRLCDKSLFRSVGKLGYVACCFGGKHRLSPAEHQLAVRLRGQPPRLSFAVPARRFCLFFNSLPPKGCETEGEVLILCKICRSAVEQVKYFVPLAEEQLNLDPVIVFRRLIKLESLP